MNRATKMSFVALASCCALAACTRAHEEPGDAAILVDAPVPRDALSADAALDAAETDAGPPMRLDVATCAELDWLPPHPASFVCEPSTVPDSDCAALHDGPAFAVVGRDLCAEALASSSGSARVQFAPAIEVLEVSCDGLVLAARAGTDGVRVDFHGHAPIAEALANDAPFSVEAEATSGPTGCIATLTVRARWYTIVLAELPALGGRLTFGTVTPPSTIDVAPMYAPGGSCAGENAVCITPSYGLAAPIAVSFCSASRVATHACEDGDYFAIGTTACDARLRLGTLIPSYVRICH